MLTYASPLAICFSGEGWLLSCGAKCLPGISSVALPPSAAKCVLQGGISVDLMMSWQFWAVLQVTRWMTFRSGTWLWRMLMSTSASPPTRTERPPSPHRSLWQKVSPSTSNRTLVWTFLNPVILFSLRVFSRSASGNVWVCLCFSRSSAGLQKDAEETVGACCLILTLTLPKPVRIVMELSLIHPPILFFFF